MKAFPTEHAVAGTMDLKADGMDLRDYFAAKAMQGLLANPEANREWSDARTALWSYEFADAMMKARQL